MPWFDLDFIDGETWMVFVWIALAITAIAVALWLVLADDRHLIAAQLRLTLIQTVTAVRGGLGLGPPGTNDPDNNLLTDLGDQARAELRGMEQGHRHPHDRHHLDHDHH